jgi:hypothetical protein
MLAVPKGAEPMTRHVTTIVRCPGCGAAFSSLDWADPVAALAAHRQFGLSSCAVRP